MNHLVSIAVAEYANSHPDQALSVLELGGGTGITTLSILLASESVNIVSVDSGPTMQSRV